MRGNYEEDIHNWGFIGYPGECVYGDNVYIDDYYMGERWLPVYDFPEYWVSTMGRLWSKYFNCFIYGSPIGLSGHIDVSMWRDNRRHHRYMHRLVAEAFIPNPNNYPLVRHLDDDPSNNCVENLAWGTSRDNVRDCIENGNFRYFSREDIELANTKRRTPVIAVNLRTGKKIEFISQQEASRKLGVNQSDISSVIKGFQKHAKGYYFYLQGYELPIDIKKYKYSRHNHPIKAIDIHTGEEIIFNGQTEAAKELGMSISSVSMVLSGKMRQARGYHFEYLDEEECEHGYY